MKFRVVTDDVADDLAADWHMFQSNVELLQQRVAHYYRLLTPHRPPHKALRARQAPHRAAKWHRNA